MMDEAGKDEGVHHSVGGPLEARLKGLKAKLHEKVKSGEVVTALKKALLPRGRARDLEEVADESYSEGDEDDDGLDSGRGGSGLVAKRRQLRRYAQDHPGRLLCKGLENMREQVGEIFGDEELGEDKYAPVVTRYLLSVLLPNYPAKHQHEDRLREMRTLAMGLDMILRGKIDGAADLFMQRFKSLSMALRDGDPRYGRYLELLPEDLIGGGATQGETEYARTMALKAAKSEGKAPTPPDSTVVAAPKPPLERRAPLSGARDGSRHVSFAEDNQEAPGVMAQEEPVRGLVSEDGAPSERLGGPSPQAGGHTLAQSLGDLFQLLDVAPDVTFNALAGQIMSTVECQHRLQLGITLLQLLLLSLRDRGHFCHFTELLETITPLAGGTQKRDAGIRQRDLLPLPIPAFGALLNLVKKHKQPGSGVIIWRVAEARKGGKQQLKKSASAACFQTWRLLSVITLNGMGTGWERLAPASGHVATRSQNLALESLARRCAWWSGSPLEVRPPGDFSELIRARQVDYTGDAVLKALPLRLEELAPGLPEDGVAGSLDASSIADEVVKCWVDDPDVALLDSSAWPHPLPSASMNVAVLYKKGIVAPIEVEEIFHVDGEPVLNGVFAVEKGGEPAPGECRVTRLIMNLVPANSLQKLMPGDLATLAGSSHWSGIHLLPNEVLLWSGDDQKGAFYAWKLPKAWRKLMAFKMPVPGRLVGCPGTPYVHVASAVIPMGWINAVSLFQHLHRRAGLAAAPVGAGLEPSNEWRRDRPVPRGAVDAGGRWFQYYLDDFDCPEKVARHTWKTMVNTMSPTQAKQRLSYDRIGIGISEKKAHVREPCVVRMGAEVDGVTGLLSAPRIKILETGWLLVWTLSRPVLSARMKMVLLARLTRCFEFRRPLMGLLNKCWPKSMWCRATPLPFDHAFELITAGALLCLAVMDLRTPVSGLVTCSDASTMGGGMCVSAGLTDAGEKLLMKLDAVERLVTHFLRIAEKGGTDVRLDAGIPFRAKAWPRSGVQSHLFKWAIVHGYPWRHSAHINVLELQAVVNSVKWRMRQADNLNHRVMLLIDSQVVCAIVAKGRTSSHRLQHALMVLNALYPKPMVRKCAQRARPQLTLHEQMVSRAMRARYSQAVLCFLTYLSDADLAMRRISELCEAASSWVEFLYADGQRKGLASDGLAGLQYFLPQCQGRLKLAWKLVKVWQRVEPPMRVLPLSPLLVLGMAGLAAGLGLPDIAAGLLICFDGILRSGELYQLRVADVTFYESRAALRLGLTKAGKRTGQEEMVVVNSRIAINWLRRACARRSGDELLIRRGPDFFRKCFKLFVAEFGLSDANINVYSLRRGGAT
ncbi:unnamed protein product [Symbiodinium sp. CCMP2456]|nr:unnamed protein product [Symbiodinium sp. CCMP2456]